MFAREQLQLRLESLQKEFEIGQGRLKELEKEEAYIRETLLRIAGAMQVLKELLQEDGSGKPAELREETEAGNAGR